MCVLINGVNFKLMTAYYDVCARARAVYLYYLRIVFVRMYTHCLISRSWSSSVRFDTCIRFGFFNDAIKISMCVASNDKIMSER
jgi:hypothetical protein